MTNDAPGARALELSTQRTRFEDLRPDLVPSLQGLHQSRDAFLAALGFIIHDTGRDVDFRANHLLGYVCQDFLQSAVAITVLAMEGALNVCKRELRFLLEAAIKLCFIQQKDYARPIGEKLKLYEKQLGDSSISLLKRIELSLLRPDAVGAFKTAVGRAYGRTSNYVHLTPLQLQERMRATDAGRTSGKESAEEMEELRQLVDEVLALVLVYVFHGSPSYVAGDFFVQSDGCSVAWRFMSSRFVAMIDEHFDYKHERQGVLAAVIEKRANGIRF